MTSEASWRDDMPAIYDRCLGPALFAPFAEHLAEAAAAAQPRSVLELAAGTGILTAELVRHLPGSRITATDLNPAMVAWAAQHVDGPTWLTADAQALTFPDNSFDVIACQFGVMFFPDKPKAFAEVARVLRPGGVLVFTVWDAVEKSPFPAALVSALTDVFGEHPPDFVVRIPHGYHESDRIRTDVEAGGLSVESIEPLVLHGSAPSARVLAEGFCHGTPLCFALQELGDIDKSVEALADRMASGLGAGPVEGDLAAYLVTARLSPRD